MIVAIHQPQYLPWLGYFNKIDQADVFCFLDDVQYKKNEWQNRNRIKTPQGWQWLTVPVHYRFPWKIDEVTIKNSVKWGRKHFQAICTNYGKARFFREYAGLFEEMYDRQWTSLADLNIEFVKRLCEALEMEDVRTVRSSEMLLTQEPTQRLIDICRQLGGDTYLAGAGGAGYRRFTNSDRRNVSGFDLEYLCVGCGACRSVCPAGAIEMALTGGQYMPVRDRDKCVDCGSCVRVCPGIRNYEEETDPGLNVHEDLGGYVSNYIGCGNNREIRKNCASGGLCSEILIHLLEEKIIDGAIVTKAAFDKGYGAETFVAETPEEVLSAKSSIYAPTSPLAAIGKIDPEKRYAFVGLPCHVQGLKKLMKVDRKVAKAVKFSMGLFCGRGVTSRATEFLLDKFAESASDVKKIRYRGNGWPGGLSVEYRNGKKYYIPHNSYWPIYLAPYFFCSYRCLTCSDFAAECADVSLGDAWLPEVTEADSIGTSIAVVRSEDMERHLKNMEKRGRIALLQTTIEKVVQSQQGIILRKKHSVAHRISLMKRMNKPLPLDIDSVALSRPKQAIGALLVYSNAAVTKKSVGLSLLNAIPAKILNQYKNYVFKYTGIL